MALMINVVIYAKDWGYSLLLATVDMPSLEVDQGCDLHLHSRHRQFWNEPLCLYKWYTCKQSSPLAALRRSCSSIQRPMQALWVAVGHSWKPWLYAWSLSVDFYTAATILWFCFPYESESTSVLIPISTRAVTIWVYSQSRHSLSPACRATTVLAGSCRDCSTWLFCRQFIASNTFCCSLS